MSALMLISTKDKCYLRLHLSKKDLRVILYDQITYHIVQVNNYCASKALLVKNKSEKSQKNFLKYKSRWCYMAKTR